jgi:hypothetical protein
MRYTPRCIIDYNNEKGITPVRMVWSRALETMKLTHFLTASLDDSVSPEKADDYAMHTL